MSMRIGSEHHQENRATSLEGMARWGMRAVTVLTFAGGVAANEYGEGSSSETIAFKIIFDVVAIVIGCYICCNRRDEGDDRPWNVPADITRRDVELIIVEVFGGQGDGDEAAPPTTDLLIEI